MGHHRRKVLAMLGAAAFPLSVPRQAMAHLTPGTRDVLLVVDVQNCFLPGGSLAVKDGDAVVPVINALAAKFRNVVITQDWHTPEHASFASAHSGKKPFETVQMSYGPQVLWPDHCVQGTTGRRSPPASRSRMPSS
jgi:nicotinamidase/pyrazinamidase